MTFSRLRFQLAASFALVFLIGLGAADAALFRWLKHAADDELTSRVTAAAKSAAQSIRVEMGGPRGTLVHAARDVLGEWPADSIGFVVYDAAGAEVTARGGEAWRHFVPTAAQLPVGERTWDVPLDDEGALRLALARAPATVTSPSFSVVALRPTAGLREADERLALWLAFSAPLVVLVALVGAYFLARLGLAPLRVMTDRIRAIAPDDLDQRLLVRAPADELDALADQFNLLLERLKYAQARNRQFLARAAHQLRTPLTVIRGESGLVLDRPRTPDEYRDVLRRVALAADQMTHRVDDLFLLARAEAGDRPPLTDQIELDGLVLDCVDLMRGRAGALGRRLELGSMEAAEVVGSEPLIREAVLELLENACRHGTDVRPIRVSTHNGDSARVEIVSAGANASELVASAATGNQPRMGLAIVRWIATTHGGRLSHFYEHGANAFSLELALSIKPFLARSPV